jgi:hypothetical protein
VLVSAAGERRIAASELFADDGIQHLTRRPDEDLTEIHVRRRPRRALGVRQAAPPPRLVRLPGARRRSARPAPGAGGGSSRARGSSSAAPARGRRRRARPPSS